MTAEHRCLLVLADAIEEQGGRRRDESSLDLEALLDRVRQLHGHFIHAHGPKDEAVISKLLEGAASARSLMTPFLQAHAIGFLENIRDLDADLQAALCGQLVAREAIVTHAKEAVRNLRAQIAMEESATYPWARGRLGARDRKDLARHIDLIRERWPSDPCAEAAQPNPLTIRRPMVTQECACAP